MNNKRTLRQVAVALMLLVAFLFQGTWALAGTTGGLSGTVSDEKGAAVAGATVKVVSASQSAQASTDASGHFNFLSLAPDTYTVAIEKSGYRPVSYAGVTVFADNQQSLSFKLEKALTTIATVTSKAAGDLVKGGVGGDIYNVNSSAIAAAASLGGGGNLNSAYSAISSVPGVNVPIGGSGWNNNVAFVRGSQSFFTGFEYDGIPVNRAFDNYNSSTESNLGLQELQVYTGGGPASITSSGTSGFINQVIKTGTYPGFASLSGGIASSAFYHQAKVEAGGATPDRNFSYYIGLSGYNQDFRFLDNSNGVGQMGVGGIFSDYSAANNGLGNNIAAGNGAFSMCDPTTGATNPATLALVNAGAASGAGPFGGFCLYPYTGLSGLTSNIADRENVVNLHFRIPRKAGQRDDLQLLWSGSMLKTNYYGSINDLGGANTYSLAQDGVPYTPNTGNPLLPPYNLAGLYNGNGAQVGCILTGACSYPFYADAWVYNARFGQNIQNMTPTTYFSPDSPTNRAMWAQLPSADRDAIYNDTGIVKLQYTHPIGDKAFIRADGYTFYSDWNQTGVNSANANYVFGYPSQALAANYILSTHTTGAEVQFVDQINEKNLIQLTDNYTQANVLRDNNSGFVLGGDGGQASPIGLISGNPTSGFTCYRPSTGAAYPCYNTIASSQVRQFSAAQVAGGFFNVAAGPPVGSAAALAGAQYVSLWDGPTKGAYNTVRPYFNNISLTDQYRPNDKWLLNFGLRYDQYTYKLPDSTTLADQFYSDITKNFSCYSPSTGTVFTAPLTAGQFPPAAALHTSGDCNTTISGILGHPVTGYAHPNGIASLDGTVAPVFNVQSPSSYNLHFLSARVSGTYTQSPDTVWRASAGRFTQPPISASTQYLDQSGNNTALWENFMQLGFFTPFHNVPAQTSGQYDLSLERHIKGTDVSFKLTPFFNFTNGYQEQSFIGAGFVTQVPVGDFKSAGIEAAVTKGDFSKNGLSGSLSLTYTKAQVNFQGGRVNNLGQNQVQIYNQSICEYDALTAGALPAGCGALGVNAKQNYACFNPASFGAAGTGVGVAGVAGTCVGGTIANPYFSAASQPLMDANGWYAPPSDVALPGVNSGLGLYDAPWVSTLILNYRHDKWAITPSIQMVSGSSYGSPFTTQGVDPRDCTAVDVSAGATAGQCAYTSLIGAGATQSGILFVPNWQTGSFDSIGAFHNPNLITGNIAFSYEVSSKVNVNLTLANLFHTCFGGTKNAWTSAYPAGSNVCGYGANGAQVSNYQLGAGYATPGNPASYSAAANGTTLYPWQFQSYAPTTGSFAGSIPAPFNAYLTVSVKL